MKRKHLANKALRKTGGDGLTLGNVRQALSIKAKPTPNQMLNAAQLPFFVSYRNITQSEDS